MDGLACGGMNTGSECGGMNVLSDKRIAELKNRIDRSPKISSAKPNGHIVERSRSSGRSTDTKLLGQ